MKRFWGMAVVVTVALAGTGLARAQSWGSLSQGATELRNPKALAALLWSQTVDCAKQSSDLTLRQCQGIQAARLAAVTKQTYLLLGDGSALVLGPYDAKTKTAELSVRACIACQAPLDVDGTALYLVGDKGSVELEGNLLKGPVLTSVAKNFDSKEATDKWRSDVLPRLRTHLVVKVPTKAPEWKKGSLAGLRFEVLGFRVHDPCNGKIIAATPKADPAPADKRYCTGEPVVEKVDPEPVAVEEPKVVEPTIPDRLDPSDIKRALAPAREASLKCYEVYGVPGTARFRITISNEGQVIQLEQMGDFIDTPTGSCIEKSINGVSFPKSKKKKTTIDYPFMLR